MQYSINEYFFYWNELFMIILEREEISKWPLGFICQINNVITMHVISMHKKPTNRF